MSNEQTVSQSRRNFLKISALTAGAVLAGSALPSFAKTAKIRKLALKDIPSDNIAMAKSSELVQNAYAYLLSKIDTLKDSSLKAKVRGLYEDTTPTFMKKWEGADGAAEAYKQLQAQNLIDPSKTPVEKLFPVLKQHEGKGPQPFWSAPGSGFASHHPYPGGLATHCAANVEITLGLLKTYHDVMGYDPDYDTALAGQLLHDLAKPWVFQWQADGSSLKEFTIAGTGAHHIFSVAESIARGLPAKEIVAQACAHDHPGTTDDEKQVVGWIRAASVFAGVDPAAIGLLSSDGEHLPIPLSQEGFIVHLGDHDWVLSSPAASACVNAIKEVAQKDLGFYQKQLEGAEFNALRNYVGSQYSFMRLHHELSAGDPHEMALKAVRRVIA